jgi:hypothetical protein
MGSKSASWGEGADPSAWTYTVAYTDLGATGPVVAPAHARSIRDVRDLHRVRR